MCAPEMLSPVYFRAARYGTAVITRAAEPAGRAHAHAAGGGRGEEERGRAVRSAPRRARGPLVRSARRVGSSPVPPASHHGPYERVRRREGAAAPRDCPEPRQAQAGSPQPAPGGTPLNPVLVTRYFKAAAIREVQIKLRHRFQHIFLQHALSFVLSMCRSPSSL